MTLITILGATASGKSDLAVELAKTLPKCWVVGCDSRQVFKRLDLGTGKVEGKWQYFPEYDLEAYSVQNIPHFLIDYVDLNKQNIENYNLIQYYKDFYSLFSKASKKPQYVVLVGGTSWYAKAIYEQIQLFETRPEFDLSYTHLKTYLAKQKVVNLQLIYSILLSQNTCFEKLNQSDFHNSERLKNTILRTVSVHKNWQNSLPRVGFDRSLTVVLEKTQTNLKNLIYKRLIQRLESGMMGEITQICQEFPDQATRLGLEYKIGQAYLQGYLSYKDFLESLTRETWRYAKRQHTWLSKQGHTKVSSLDDIVHILT